MTTRVSYAPQDFQKMCKQAERDHESKKLALLMDRVKRQIAESQHPEIKADSSSSGAETAKRRFPSRTTPFER